MALFSSRVGRAWLAIREHDVAAAAIGVNITYYKLLAFAVSSFMIGLGGALDAYFVRFVSADTYTLDLAIGYVAMIIIGGLGSLPGSVIRSLRLHAPAYHRRKHRRVAAPDRRRGQFHRPERVLHRVRGLWRARPGVPLPVSARHCRAGQAADRPAPGRSAGRDAELRREGAGSEGAGGEGPAPAKPETGGATR